MRESLSEFERQISRLSDGQLSPADAGQLNRLLKNDPISQEAYLDHLLLDALLEMEFAGASVPASPPLSESTLPARKASALPQAQSFRGRMHGLRNAVSSRKFLTPLALG